MQNVHQLMQQTPTLEQQAQEACLQEVLAALDKYGCHLVFQEVRQNGQIVNGQFVVLKKP